ncbi:hypothetical protein J4476_05405 [Candidatus Woesearchaeota archaeon]|nr:MAG: hypothetical protein QT09_C0017G0006 [archaeon GW2011_AR18]MBS3162102.1 hypothetical protein [Candidatus Woesearchaeota archaeon]HIH25268.1 hypothetical protein [Nanoarchaeota archaeon]
MDGDIDSMSLVDLKNEIIKLRDGIREHRDEKSHGRCWLDDARLYKLLPENINADFKLPNKDEFLFNCEKYWKERQPQ